MRRLQHWLSADRVAALLFLCLFAVYGLMGSRIRSALSVDVVGPGFFPMAVGILGAALALIFLLQPVKKEGEAVFEPDLVALAPIAMLLLYVISLPIVGFIVATPIFLAIAFKFLGCPGWIRAVIFALIATAVVVFIFVYLLDVRLPTSHIEAWWASHG
jgi:putative tricarboxylic transport membrane protein